ncbi:SipW-cognate class signal peptide [Halogranum gelatinilyticum]|uniref:SipW-cognate class signal peptide n=1 Tax=Halogranum gelatinilyticum TaxID=660521 RepID=A0A1G9VVN5_9EURY|nr:SipW-dependent-type signal peptide-containing protein [Halogranum gelatinilyticum]SDM76324.1 SipW-cognate class signal peptide [Halogranum gelatinilyticum]
MADKKLNLSRRNVLAGLGTIGLASAGAGIGTTAYFNDTESFTDNTLTAGSLDLAVQATVYEYQAEANGGGETFGPVVINGENGVSQQLTDVKPGDYSYGTFCFSLVDNPGYIWAGGELTANDENTVNEPEADADPNNTTESSSPIDGEGELADAIEAVLYCVDDGYVPGDQGRPSENESIPVAGDAELVFEGSLREVLAALQAGIPLDNDSSTADREPFPGTPEQDFSGKCLAFAWELPTEVGNEVQTDSVEFDLTFYAVQSRHNDGTANPFVDDSFVSGQYDADSNYAADESGHLTLDVAYGTSQTLFKITDVADSFDYMNNILAVDSDDDGTADWQVIWQPGHSQLPSGTDTGYSEVITSGGNPVWEKDQTGMFQNPSDVSNPILFASHSGNVLWVAVDNSAMPNPGDNYRVQVDAFNYPDSRAVINADDPATNPIYPGTNSTGSGNYIVTTYSP